MLYTNRGLLFLQNYLRVEPGTHGKLLAALEAALNQTELTPTGGAGHARASLGRRQEIIEPRLAQLKQHEGFRRWTVSGPKCVRTQAGAALHDLDPARTLPTLACEPTGKSDGACGMADPDKKKRWCRPGR